MVVWYNDHGGYSADVFARRVRMDGSLASWFSVVAVPGELHWYPSVAYNEAREEYLVAWERWGTSIDIIAARVRWDGGWIGSPFVVNDDVDSQRFPDVVANPDHDEYLVTYTNELVNLTVDVAAQRVAGDGSLLSWANIATGANDRSFTAAALKPPWSPLRSGVHRVGDLVESNAPRASLAEARREGGIMSEPTAAGTAPVVLQLDKGTYYWCACGRSATQPWCDGSHAGTGFQPVAVTVEAPAKMALCLCKHTGDQPRCDGSHSRLG